MANETLSLSQANQIMQNFTNSIDNCAKNVLTKNEEFAKNVSVIWEDQNAVDFSKKLENSVTEMIRSMKKNNAVFNQTVSDIAKTYMQVGGITITGIQPATIPPMPTIDFSIIKNKFADGENGDEFGFRNPETGAEQVMDTFDTLKTSLSNIAGSISSEIKKINAFGNQAVQGNLAKSGGRIVNILEDGIRQLEMQVRQHVDQTAQSYIKTGTSAESTANLSSN